MTNYDFNVISLTAYRHKRAGQPQSHDETLILESSASPQANKDDCTPAKPNWSDDVFFIQDCFNRLSDRDCTTLRNLIWRFLAKCELP